FCTRQFTIFHEMCLFRHTDQCSCCIKNSDKQKCKHYSVQSVGKHTRYIHIKKHRGWRCRKWCSRKFYLTRKKSNDTSHDHSDKQDSSYIPRHQNKCNAKPY